MRLDRHARRGHSVETLKLFDALVAAADQRRGALQAVNERRQDALQERTRLRAERTLLTYTGREATGPADLLPNCKERDTALGADLSALDAEIQGLSEEVKKFTVPAQVAGSVANAAYHFLAHTKTAPAPDLAPRPKLPAKLDGAAVARLREEIAAKAAEADGIPVAPFLEADLADHVNRQVANLGAHAYLGGPLPLDGLLVPNEGFVSIDIDRNLRDHVTPLAWEAALRPDALISFLIARAPAPTNLSLSVAERPAAVARLHREVLGLELQEELTIRAGLAAGLDLLRRPDADPRAVLCSAEGVPIQVVAGDVPPSIAVLMRSIALRR